MEEEKMADKIRVLLGEEEVNKRINEVAEQINKDYAGKDIHLICILKGGVFFACELAKRITVPVSLDFMQVSSYGDATESSGIVRIKKDLDDTMENKEVIIVEDIIDSGRSMKHLLEYLHAKNPKQVIVATLFHKPKAAVCQVPIAYKGIELENDFVVGRGLDYDGLGRNYPDLYILNA